MQQSPPGPRLVRAEQPTPDVAQMRRPRPAYLETLRTLQRMATDHAANCERLSVALAVAPAAIPSDLLEAARAAMHATALHLQSIARTLDAPE